MRTGCEDWPDINISHYKNRMLLMCYALYIGSNSDLPLIPAPDWKALKKEDFLDNAPRLVVEGFGKNSPGYAVVRKHFSAL